MKNIMIIVGVVGAVAVLGFAANSYRQKSIKSDLMMKEDVVKPNNLMMEKSDSNEGSMMSGSRYIDYTKTVLENAQQTRRILFFYASWCSTCRPADASFSQNADKLPEDVTLIRVNYNDPETDQDEKDLAKKYGVTYQHTFVQIDGGGNEIAKWNGGQIEELLSNIK